MEDRFLAWLKQDAVCGDSALVILSRNSCESHKRDENDLYKNIILWRVLNISIQIYVSNKFLVFA